MAATVALADTGGPAQQAIGQLKASVFTVTFTGTYSTGGESLPASVLGMNNVIFVSAEAPIGAGYVLAYDYATSKLKVYRTGATTAAVLQEVPNGTDITAATGGRLLVLGR